MMIERQNLFEARTDGCWTYRIQGIAVTKRDVVLVSTEARPGKGSDYDYNDILLRRSTDGGRTFAPFVKLVDHAVYGNGPASSFVMIPDRDSGRIVALFCHDYARVFTIHSDDDGSCVSLVYSDDRGRSWQRGEMVVPQAAVKNPSETVCVELSDGRVLFNVRTESERHRRLISISPDRVGDWSAPVFDEALIEPGWAGYSDFAWLADGTILCLYECDIVTGMADDRYLRLARFDLEWLSTPCLSPGIPIPSDSAGPAGT